MVAGRPLAVRFGQDVIQMFKRNTHMSNVSKAVPRRSALVRLNWKPGLLLLFLFLFFRSAFAQDLTSLPLEKHYTQERVSSADSTGANDDGNWKHPIKAGEQRTIADLSGPGIITHLWFTIASDEPYHLKK